MTVKELKDVLEKYNDDDPVVVYTSDGEIVDAMASKVKLSENGLYQSLPEQMSYNTKGFIQGLLISP